MNDTSLVNIEQPGEMVSLKRPPDQVLEEAHKAAVALKRVIDAKPKKVMFNNEQYLEFEDWQTLGRFYGVTAKVVDTEYVEYGDIKGFSARAVAVRADGMEISAAEASCLSDEDKWATRPKYETRGGVRTQVADESVPLFQLKSMAQTRACAKVLRNVLAWVAVLAGYRPTPAEELEAERHANAGGAATHAVHSDGQVRVTDVTSKSGTSAGGRAWTKYTVTLSDGQKGGTFDDEIGRLAAQYKMDDVPVTATFEQDGKFQNIVGIKKASGGEAHDDAPHESKAASNVFTVTSVVKLYERAGVVTYGIAAKELPEGARLMTSDAELAKVAVGAKKNGERVEAAFTEKSVKNGDLQSIERWLTSLSIVMAKTGVLVDDNEPDGGELSASDMKWS